MGALRLSFTGLLEEKSNFIWKEASRSGIFNWQVRDKTIKHEEGDCGLHVIIQQA
jgi:hypothetical protein